jgi:branched-chain amino acid transport system substrate-binding protein
MLIRALTIAAALALGIASASAQVKIGLMVSATGPTTAIGIPQKNTGELLPKKIGDTTIEYISSRTAAIPPARCRTRKS